MKQEERHSQYLECPARCPAPEFMSLQQQEDSGSAAAGEEALTLNWALQQLSKGALAEQDCPKALLGAAGSI